MLFTLYFQDGYCKFEFVFDFWTNGTRSGTRMWTVYVPGVYVAEVYVPGVYYSVINRTRVFTVLSKVIQDDVHYDICIIHRPNIDWFIHPWYILFSSDHVRSSVIVNYLDTPNWYWWHVRLCCMSTWKLVRKLFDWQYFIVHTKPNS
jgi:hypothetical protein